MPANEPDPPTSLTQVAPGIRVLALRTPTLPPAAHTNAYLVGPAKGPQALVDPGSPYPDQQALLFAVLDAEAEAGRPLAVVLLTHHHGDHTGGASAVAARYGVPIAAHGALWPSAWRPSTHSEHRGRPAGDFSVENCVEPGPSCHPGWPGGRLSGESRVKALNVIPNCSPLLRSPSLTFPSFEV